MLVVMKVEASAPQIVAVEQEVRRLGYTPTRVAGGRTAICITGNAGWDPGNLEGLAGVADVVSVSKPFKLVSRETHPDSTVVDVGGVRIGGEELVVVGGPCAVESREQAMTIAKIVRDAGAQMYRGGAYKPRTSPYAFQGLEVDALHILREIRETYGLPIVTEVIDEQSADQAAEYVDMLQIGARNMQNFALLRHVAKIERPVLLKRGMSATLEEWLMAAEYLLAGGNNRVVLCERGIRTYSDHARNTLDLSVVPAVKDLSHLPIMVDPSHGTGRRDKVMPMGRAAVACGADGLLIETHHDPEHALSDGPQSLYPSQFAEIVQQVHALAPVIGRK